MKIRQKITIWIAATALVAALGSTVFVFIEFLDEPNKLIDAELEHMAEALVTRNIDSGGRLATVDARRLPYPPDLYWIKVIDGGGQVCYKSALVDYLDIPRRNRSAYYIEKIVPRERLQLGQDERDEVTFRVNLRKIPVDDAVYTVMIAKPVEFLEEELEELAREVAAGIATCTLLLLLLSYFVAGRILAPIGAINSLAREITGKTLGKRIPVGESRDELGELGRTLNLMFDRLQNSFEHQKQFLAAAAHELKSPVSLMMLAQEELLQRPGISPELKGEIEKQLNIMRRLKVLLNKLLDLSRLEMQDTLNLRDTDPGRLIEEVMSEYQDMIDHKGIRLEADMASHLKISADPGKIRRLVINIIDNAIRYNIPSGRIEVSLRAERDEVVLRVGNSGPGIPPEDLERVFDQFYRVEKSRATALGGSGLGLTIARRIVELHHGGIVMNSRPDDWTEVTVRLPLAAHVRMW